MSPEGEQAACKGIWTIPTQTNAGIGFRAKTGKMTNLEFDMTDVVVAVLMGVEGGNGGK